MVTASGALVAWNSNTVLGWRENRKKKEGVSARAGPQGTETNFDVHNLGVTSLWS